MVLLELPLSFGFNEGGLREASSPLHGVYELLLEPYTTLGPSLIALLVNNLPAMQETLVRFLGQKDLLEKG